MEEKMNDNDLENWLFDKTNKKLFPGAKSTEIAHGGRITEAIKILFSVITQKDCSVFGEKFTAVAGIGDGYLYLLPRREN